MKKLTLGLLAVSVAILMITSAYAQAAIPEPWWCKCKPTGFTPGFWKHNIKVYLGITNGKYSAFSRDGVTPFNFKAGDKLTDDIMDDLLDAINTKYDPDVTFEQLLEALEGPGWSEDRTNAANLLNERAGYGPYDD